MATSPPERPALQTRLRDGDRLAVLVNAAARSTHDRRAIERAVRTLERRYRVDVSTPVNAEQFDAAVHQAADCHDAVIVAGGDGTLNRAANAISGIDVPLGLLPLGTGNDFARAMGWPTTPAAAATRILDGVIRQIDLVAVNQRLFCTVGVFGLAAEATLAFDDLLRPGSWMRPVMRACGGWSYRIAGLKALLARGVRLDRVSLLCAGEAEPEHPQPIFGAFVTNTTWLGGGMQVPIDADAADGHFEIACITAMPRLRLYWAFTCLANGWRVPAGVMRVVRTTQAVVTCDHALTFAADGERLGDGTCFTLEIRPGALRVLC
jgi:diacylglycerol kinase (ATP)